MPQKMAFKPLKVAVKCVFRVLKRRRRVESLKQSQKESAGRSFSIVFIPFFLPKYKTLTGPGFVLGFLNLHSQMRMVYERNGETKCGKIAIFPLKFSTKKVWQDLGLCIARWVSASLSDLTERRLRSKSRFIVFFLCL